jgi:hypothetical protein
MGLEERLKALEATLAVQGKELSAFERSRTSDKLVRVRKELADPKQITPQYESRARPVIVADMSKSGLPTDVERAVSERLKGNISSEQLYKIFGLVRRRYD